MRIRPILFLAAPAVAFAAAPSVATAQAPAPAPFVAPAVDHQHDFDWMFGTWKATLSRLDKPLTGSTTWVEFEGMQTSKRVWNGRANLDEFVVHSPKAGVDVEGVTLRLYDPRAQEWRIYWANSRRAIVDPPVVGRFTNGRGEFYGMDTHEGRSILVRYVWYDITSTSAKFEQSFSIDGGRTWEPNWRSTITRVGGETP